MQNTHVLRQPTLPDGYRTRVARLLRGAGCQPEEVTAWCIYYLDGRTVDWCQAHLGRSRKIAIKRIHQADRLLDQVLANRHHEYRDECPCAGCELERARVVLAAVRNSLAGKRPQKAPQGDPDENGRAWPLRGPRVRAEDLTAWMDRLDGRERVPANAR